MTGAIDYFRSDPTLAKMGFRLDPSDKPPQRFVRADDDVKIWLIACAIVGAIFLLLQNRYWVPGGDSEVYLGSAINLVKGNGYLFNGQPTKISPPGWPLVLAGLLKISPTFLFLKLVTMACMWAGLATYYWVIRRFAPPKLCAAVIVLTALISHVYQLTFWLHSDALFVWITASTLLLCQQVAEGEKPKWRCIVLALLAIAAVLNRWAAIVNLALIAGALLDGRWRPRLNLWWLATVGIIVVSFVTFRGEKMLMSYYAPPRVSYEGSAIDAAAIPPPDMGGDSGNISDAPSLLASGGGGQTGLVTRVIGFGSWLSYLLWQPFRMAGGLHVVYWLATFVGWVVFAFLLTGVASATRSRRWLLPCAILYVAALCLRWPQANARYLVPIAPLLVLTICLGVASAPRWMNIHWQRKTWSLVGLVGLISIALCNASLYAIEASVARSSHFADRYEAGIDKNIIAAAEYLRGHNVGHWQACVNPETKNLNRRRLLPTGSRMLSMLTNKGILTLPTKWMADTKVPNSPPFRKQFLAKNHIRYYLEQPDVMTWRVWHFKMPWLEAFYLKHFEHQPMPTNVDDSGWKLYRCIGSETPVQVLLPDDVKFPTRVPGF